jgi:biotin carboxylase
MMVFVGKRDGALAAAQRLGVEVVLVVERAPRRTPPIVRAVIEHPFSSDDWRGVARRLRTFGDPEGVLALTESAVLPAALLRHELALHGLQPAQAHACMDKAAMKQAVAASGLRCARFVTAEDALSAGEIVARLGLPLVVKPARSSGGRGVRRIDALAGLPPRLPAGHMAESFVHGIEMSVESLVHDGTPVFVNVTEYYEPRWANLIPADLAEPERVALLDLNRRAIHALGIERGITHVEAFLGPQGLHFGELAARPPGGHLMELIELVYGFDPWESCIELERDRPVAPMQIARCYAGVRVLHPGAGIVVRVIGLEEIEALPQLARLVCRAQEGDAIAERVGTGQEVGYVVFRAAQRAAVATALDAARRIIRFELR